MLRKLHKTLRGISLILSMVLATVLAAEADETRQPAGTVSLETTSIAVGVGVDWGEGLLILNDGRQYPFSLKGLEIGSVGATKVSAEGKVYNLHNVSDFAGRYIAGKADIAIGGGPGTVAMRNQHGVVIHLRSVQQGVKLTLAAEGIEIELDS